MGNKNSNDSDDKKEQNLKCMMVGAVDKRSTFICYMENTQSTLDVPDVRVDNWSVKIQVDDVPVLLNLWDTAWQNEYDQLRPLAYPNTDVFIIFFSLVDTATFNSVSTKWIPEITKHCPKAPFLIVGIDSHLRGISKNTVSHSQGKQLAIKSGAVSYLECSSTSCKGIKEVFEETVRNGLKMNYKKQRKIPLHYGATWECDCCKFQNDHSNNKMCSKCNSKKLDVKILPYYGHQFKPFSITISYSNSSDVTIRYMLEKITKVINNIKSPKVYYIHQIYKESFVKSNAEEEDAKQWNEMCNTLINSFDGKQISDKGLVISIRNKFTHNVYENHISCQYIQKYLNTDDEKTQVDAAQIALKCPIYSSLKSNEKFTIDGLKHLWEYTHFKDEFREKSICQHGQRCKSFIRLENGGNKLNDKIHIKLYRHPPRNNRQVKLQDNMNTLLINTDKTENHPRYTPTTTDNEQFDKVKGYSTFLISEVIANGYRHHLCLECSKADECNHTEYSLLTIVDEKLNHIRHTQMGKPLRRDHMLALLLYTDYDSNYDLCKCQRNGDYEKWKWFDYILWNAIYRLAEKEKASYKLYSGLSNVQISEKEIPNGYFRTYTSTSYQKTVAQVFTKGSGMIIEIDKQVRNSFTCCDVSWISKFENECEVLIARNINSWDMSNNFVLSILDSQQDIQTVLLTRKQ